VLDDSSGLIRSVVDTDTGIYGFLVRPFPASPSNTPTSETPESGPCDVLRRGYLGIKLYGDNPAIAGAPVYIWGQTSAGNHVQGGVEAAMFAADGFAIPGATFKGPADAGGFVEISYNIDGLVDSPPYEAMLGAATVTASAKLRASGKGQVSGAGSVAGDGTVTP